MEGLLRHLPKRIEKSRLGILNGVRDSFSEHAGVSAWIDFLQVKALCGEIKGKGKGKANDVGLDYEGEGDTQVPWTMLLASAICKISVQLQSELIGKQLITHFTEWCDTPLERSSGYATPDSCQMFSTDPTSAAMHRVPKSPSNNIYFYLEHPLYDPLENAHVERLMRFLQTTFYMNAASLRCHLAAMALTLRGFNVDRAFWTVGGGGVGQSLLSYLIANVWSSSHAFLDMNIYYSDDELRKQCELLAGKCVVTGQENPDVSREMREDLYKKHITGDPVACRFSGEKKTL